MMIRPTGPCTLPIAAWARDLDSAKPELKGATLAIDAAVFDPHGRKRVVISLQGPLHDPEDLGRRAAQALLEQGAGALLARLGLPI
jgi:porphobilinogen deaminase